MKRIGQTMAEQTSISYYQTEFKFNGKELDSETGMYYYGARYYDPSLSIWMSVDPLAEQFPNFSPYNYTMNNPINMIDPDGRAAEAAQVAQDPGDEFKTLLSAVLDFAKEYNGMSIAYDLEIGTTFYSINDSETGETTYSYAIPIVGDSGSVRISEQNPIPSDADLVGDGHTHSGDTGVQLYEGRHISEDNQISGSDICVYENCDADLDGVMDGYGKPVKGYVVTPNGSLLEFIPGKDYQINNKLDPFFDPTHYEYNIPITTSGIPSDKASKSLRKNNISHEKMPNVLPSNFDPSKYEKREGY